MKAVNTLLISALCSLLIGALVLIYPEDIAIWLVRIIGALFLIPGLVSLLVYFARKQSKNTEEVHTTLPLTAIGSILLGGFLLVMPDSVQAYIIYVVALFPAVFSLNQVAYLWRMKSTRTIGLGFFIWPVLVIIGAIVICLKPIENVSLLLTVAALLCLLYACTELFNLLYFRRDFKTTVVSAPSPAIESPNTSEEALAETTMPSIPTSLNEDDSLTA